MVGGGERGGERREMPVCAMCDVADLPRFINLINFFTCSASLHESNKTFKTNIKKNHIYKNIKYKYCMREYNKIQTSVFLS